MFATRTIRSEAAMAWVSILGCGILVFAGTAAAHEAAPLDSQKAKNSYALGASLGGSVRELTIDVDRDLVLQGFKDTLSTSNTLMNADEVRATVLQLQKEQKEKKIAAAKEFAERNKKDTEVFFAANRAKEGVIVLPSGLQYRVLKEGDGKRPSLQDKVVCHYRGTLIDGTEFDSSYSRQQPATFAVSRVIKGWTEALQLMPVGSKWQLFVPPNLAYGERGSGRIGPDATLLFEVELLSIQG
jgi:FKBP-type peptidyl-prolyl cis-trans isomerase